MASRTEWIKVRLPDGFDPARHSKALEELIADHHGDGFEIDAIDLEAGIAHALRRVSITEVDRSEAGSIEVNLSRGTKAADGERVAARLADSNPGWTMTAFDPHLGRAVLSRLSDASIRARGAVAVALGVKPWQVGVSPRPDGGFDLTLPNSYVASRHDARLDEVATTVVGREGWYVQIDPAALTGSIIPSAPPTFPAALDFPIDTLGADRDRIRFGRALPAPGEELGDELSVDLAAAPFVLLAGVPGSGKSALLTCLIAEAVAAGSELAIVDLPSKAVDFMWCKSLVRPGGWGCDSLEASVAALSMIYGEGERRANVLASAGAVSWTELAPEQRFPPVFVVVDEVSALLVPEAVPKGIPKDHPILVEVLQANLLRATLSRFINKIVAEMRFVGIRLVLSSQVVNNSTGVGPSLKAKVGHHILQGSNPSRQARGQAFNDEAACPEVPGNVRADSRANRGVGVCELEGLAPTVFKGYFATPAAYRKALDARGAPTTDRPSPTPSEIARHTPSLDDTAGPVDAGPSGGRLGDNFSAEVLAADPRWDVDEDGNRLTGYAKANAARHALRSTTRP